MAWLSDWSHRIKCTVDGSKIDDNLYDFPIPITLASGVGITDYDLYTVMSGIIVKTTVFSDDFSAGGSQWTDMTGTADYSSGYLSHNADAERARTINNVSIGTSWVITFKFMQAGSGSNGDQLYIAPVFDPTMAGRLYFYLRTYASGDNYLKLYVENSDRGNITKYNWYNYCGSWFNTKVQRIGYTIYFKVWLTSEVEPTTWDITTSCTDSLATSAKFDFETTYTASSGSGLDDVLIATLAINKSKVAFTDSDGTTQLPAEIEIFSTEEKIATYWTKLPTMSSGSNKIFYMYYDNTKADNSTYIGETGSAVAEGVWDSNFKGVWHFNKTPSNTSLYFTDSTSTHNHGTPANFESTDIDLGKIGYRWSFDGSNESIGVTHNSTVSLVNDYTLEAVVYPTSKDTVDQIISKTSSDTTGYQLRGDAGTYNFMTGVGTAGSYPYDNNTWYYLTGTFSGTSVKLYVNGYLYHSVTASTSGTPTNVYNFNIGVRWDGGNFFNGNMSEIRISSTTRNAAWIKASYYAIWDDLITYEIQDIPTNVCSGIVTVDSSPTNGIDVCLYRRSTGQLMDKTTTSGSGVFTLGSVYDEEHFVVALYTTSGTNALIYDWIAP